MSRIIENQYNQERLDKSGYKKLFTRNSCINNSHPSIVHFFSIFKQMSILATLFLTTLLLSNCNFKSPATETPTPNEESIEKNFFVETQVDQGTQKIINKPKTFLCGWASESEVGSQAEESYMNNVLVPAHCNLVFEITENALIGKQINPSFPDDPKRWEVALIIPIKGHYYLEKEKDSAGREVNRLIKNSSRSHWSARTHMDLDLNGIKFDLKWQNYGIDSGANISVEQVEWDFKNQFLGFTINRLNSGSSNNRLRFNIKGFEHDSQFVMTPFDEKNYRKMNVLHIIGEKVNGLYQKLHAAHWDTKKTHEIRLWKVPQKWVPVIKEVVQDWNEVFKNIGATKTDLFVISDKEAERAFDLRYTTIAWIEDEKISSYSALGVGMALSDVRNGEMKWGMITLFGGMLEKSVKAFTPSTSAKAIQNKNQILNGFISKAPKKLSAPAGIMKSDYRYGGVNNTLVVNGPLDNKSKQAVKDFNFSQNTSDYRNVIFQNLGSILGSKIESPMASMGENFYENILRKNIFSSLEADELEFNQALMNNESSSRSSRADEKNKKAQFRKNLNNLSANFCNQRTFEDIGSGWIAGKELLNGDIDKDEKILRNIIKELVTHEFGHLIGLGHQFKENILPTKGTVPDSVYNTLLDKAVNKNMTQYTSVMGYRNPVTEIIDTEVVKPGPHDVLVLRYLYNQEFATYKQGDKDFTFQKIPSNGLIPDNGSYFPQCNDVDATLAMDPFCNRFDRGYSATTIVKNYFDELKNTSVQSMFTFSETRGSNPESYEAYMWQKAFSVLGRVRLFYDYMRLYFKNEFDQIRQSEDTLYDFSDACAAKEIKNEKLNELFSKKPEFKELCLANRLALEEYKNLVSKNVTDFTKKNFEQRFSPGGMSGGDVTRDWGQFTGTWTEISGTPFKMATLYTLTTGVPYMTEYGMMGVPLYNDPNYKFSYATLYPKEFIQIMANNLKANLHFSGEGNSEKTKMGPSLSSMGWFNYMFKESHNDFSLLPESYKRSLQNYYNFDFSMGAVIITGQKKNNAPNTMEAFSGKIYDFNSQKEIPVNKVNLLPGGRVIVEASGMFIYPITNYIPFEDDKGYAIAYRLDFSQDKTDRLSSFGPKTELKTLNDRLLDSCFTGTNGQKNGLSYFFKPNNPLFEGILMPSGIATDDGRKAQFIESINSAFNTYYQNSKESIKPGTCEETLRGIALIISTSAMMNGYWLPEANEFIQK